MATRARILADYVSSGVTAAEFDFLDTTSGTPGSGTFLRGDKTWVAAGSTSASDLDSGTLAVARMAAGTVIQVVNISTTSTYALSSNQQVWQTVGFQQAITPKRTDTKFLVTCSLTMSTGGASSFLVGFKATGSSITTQAFGVDDTNPIIRRFTEGGQNLGNQRSVVFDYLTGNLSQGNTTDAITFAIWGRTTSVTDLYIGTRDGSTSTEGTLMLTVMEVA